MFKNILLVGLILFVFNMCSFANNLNIGFNSGIYTPSSGQSSVMYGVYADYAIYKNLLLRGEANTTTYTDSNNMQETYTPISVLLIYVIDNFKFFRPYLDGGPVISNKKNSQSTIQTIGARLGCGITNKIGPASVSFDISYYVYDFNNMSQGTTTYNLGGSGNLALDL